MKTILLAVLLLAGTGVSAEPINPTVPSTLENIREFAKNNFEGNLWIDFSSCDMNTLTIYQGNIAYTVKLTSLEGTEIKHKRKRKKSVPYLELQTFQGAKIKSEESVSSSDIVVNGIGLVDDDNGIGYINSLAIYGDEDQLLELQNLINQAITLQK